MSTSLAKLIEHAKLTPIFDFNVSACLRKTKLAEARLPELPEVLYGQHEKVIEIHETLSHLIPGYYEIELDIPDLKYEIDTVHGELPYLQGYSHAKSIMMLVDGIGKASMNFNNE